MFTDALRSLCATLVVCLCFLSGPASAQQADTTEQQLPEIAPREIEIRGELQVSFPSLQRQPLRGFTTPPTIPSVPEGHRPYVASYKQELENLPESLPAPQAVSHSVSTPASPKQGFLQFGGGRYASRFAEGRYSLSLTQQQSLSFHGDYFGMEGFSPFPSAASDLSTPMDTFHGRVRFESRHDDLSFQTSVFGMGERYTLYGLAAQIPGATVPERSGLQGGASAQLETFGSVESTVRLRYARTGYDLQSAFPSPSFTETQLGLNGALSFDLGTATVHLDASLDRSTYGGDVPSSSGYAVEGGAGVEILSTDQASVRVGGRVLNFEAPVNPQTSPTRSVTASYVVPQGRAELSLAPGVTLFAENAPALKESGLADLYAENPYAEAAPPLRPTLFTTNAESGALLSVGPVRFHAVAGFNYAPSYQYFSSPVSLANAPMQVNYGSARILRGGGQLVLQGIEGIEASLETYVRDGTLVGPDAPIPYFSPVVANAMFSVSFANQRGLLQTTGTIESPRPINQTGSPEVGTHVAFNLKGTYEITSLLDIVLQIRNLSPEAPKRWAQYPRPPATAMAGFRIHW